MARCTTYRNQTNATTIAPAIIIRLILTPASIRCTAACAATTFSEPNPCSREFKACDPDHVDHRPYSAAARSSVVPVPVMTNSLLRKLAWMKFMAEYELLTAVIIHPPTGNCPCGACFFPRKALLRPCRRSTPCSRQPALTVSASIEAPLEPILEKRSGGRCARPMHMNKS